MVGTFNRKNSDSRFQDLFSQLNINDNIEICQEEEKNMSVAEFFDADSPEFHKEMMNT